MKYLLIPLFFLTGVLSVDCQDTLTFEEQFEQEYLIRIQKTHINGFYIPKDIADAMRILDEIIDERGKLKFSYQPDSVAVNKVFFSFGRWINVNWGMEQGSRLTVDLNKYGVSFPDDMTRMIMYAYHYHLNQVPLDMDALVKRVVQERLTRQKEMNNSALNHPHNQTN